MYSGISLVNGAKLHLTVKGTNTLTAGFGGADTSVPDGCTLEITSASAGTLNATGGKNYGGGSNGTLKSITITSGNVELGANENVTLKCSGAIEPYPTMSSSSYVDAEGNFKSAETPHSS